MKERWFFGDVLEHLSEGKRDGLRCMFIRYQPGQETFVSWTLPPSGAVGLAQPRLAYLWTLIEKAER
jgi:hypothetical protein